jgi:hypothetical protein
MTILSMKSLADTWKLMGELCDPDIPIRVEVLGDALNLYKECLRVYSQTIGPDHSDTQETQTDLSECQELFNRATKELNASSTKANNHVVV